MKRILLSLTIILFSSVGLIAQSNKNLNISNDNVAAAGYDLVSYFDGSPTPGMEYMTVDHKGVTYQFATAHNKNLFEESPEKYLPMYGGYCAFGMSKNGQKLNVDPMSYKIMEDRLYLFFKNKKVEALNLWNQNEKELNVLADQNWEDINK